MNNRIHQILKEEINKVLAEKRKTRNNKQDEYIAKNGHKEQNSMRGEFMKLINNPAVNNAELSDEMRNIDPNLHVDSSRLTKVGKEKPGASGGHFHPDKHMADIGLQAASRLGL